ncbi:MAG: hypothetical protein AVDCRST_MAG19-474, partial [uncultured Thermomicrobiales bacterium]
GAGGGGPYARRAPGRAPRAARGNRGIARRPRVEPGGASARAPARGRVGAHARALWLRYGRRGPV